MQTTDLPHHIGRTVVHRPHVHFAPRRGVLTGLVGRLAIVQFEGEQARHSVRPEDMR